MSLYKCLDWWSIMDGLDEIMLGRGNDCFRNSEYVGYYDELLTEMANVAGDFWNECDSIKNDILNHNIPYKANRSYTIDSESYNALYWFNTVALMFTETNIGVLLYREETYVNDDESEKEKRIRILERLPKKDFIWLVQTVSNLIIRYLELEGAWQSIKGIIDELDSRQAFIKEKGELKPSKSSYL